MAKKVFVQNILSPYRCHLFNTLYKEDSNYEVYYMGKTEKDRNWDPNKLDISHKHWIDRWGLYFMFCGFHIHVNPVLVLKILLNRDINDLILGASYCDFNIIVLALFKHLHLTRKRFHFWAEANYLTLGARKDNRIKRWLRAFVYSSADGYFIVPGKMAVETFKKWGFFNNKYILFPNTIDEENLHYHPVIERESNLPQFLIPARLIEEIKGLLNFFRAIGLDNIKKAQFLIAGDGPDYNLYKDFIEENQLEEHIFLLGFCDTLQMNQLYNRVEALILPSFSDPSPLSLVEALKFHLPILCSSHCGNHYEAVKEGENGFVFSPSEIADIRGKFEKLLECQDSWKKMGQVGYDIFSACFETKRVALNFMNKIEQ